MQRRGQLLEDLGVLADKAGERGPPRRQRNRVDQSERAVAGAVEQMCPQGDGPAEVVGNHQGFLQAPVLHEFGEEPALGSQGDILAGGLLRCPVTGHVPYEHLVMAGE